MKEKLETKRTIKIVKYTKKEDRILTQIIFRRIYVWDYLQIILESIANKDYATLRAFTIE